MLFSAQNAIAFRYAHELLRSSWWCWSRDVFVVLIAGTINSSITISHKAKMAITWCIFGSNWYSRNTIAYKNQNRKRSRQVMWVLVMMLLWMLCCNNQLVPMITCVVHIAMLLLIAVHNGNDLQQIFFAKGSTHQCHISWCWHLHAGNASIAKLIASDDVLNLGAVGAHNDSLCMICCNNQLICWSKQHKRNTKRICIVPHCAALALV